MDSCRAGCAGALGRLGAGAGAGALGRWGAGARGRWGAGACQTGAGAERRTGVKQEEPNHLVVGAQLGRPVPHEHSLREPEQTVLRHEEDSEPGKSPPPEFPFRSVGKQWAAC